MRLRLIRMLSLIRHKCVEVYRIIVFGFVILSLLSACLDKMPETLATSPPLDAVLKLNKNVEGFRCLAYAYTAADSIAIFSIMRNYDGSVLYMLNMKEGGNIELYSEIVSPDIVVPELSMEWDGEDFYWTVNNVRLTDSEGFPIAVSDLSKPVNFLLRGETICCKVSNAIVNEYSIDKDDYLANDVVFDYDNDDKAFRFHLSSGFTATLPTISEFHLLDENVPNRSFYKDFFLDAGIGLNSRKSLAAAEFLGLSLEGICFPRTGSTSKDYSLQKAIVAGDSKDLNGRLLYPDGQPRYRLLFVNGGVSTDHGKSLEAEGLDAMRTFVKNGGSYVGACAGAFFASNGSNGKKDYPYYLSIWPGMMRQSGLENIQTGMFIEKNSPLLKYYDFGGDSYVESIRHNLGGFPVKFPLKTEILARFDYPDKKLIHRQPSIWAYKNTPQTGRVVVTGSHPELAPDGERRDLTVAMIRYALDGVGSVSVKGFLRNGEERVMDKFSTDNNPAYTRIGDLQTHHFAAYIPSGARNIRLKLESSSECDLALMISQDSYAFADVAEHHSDVPGSSQQMSFPSLKEGVWYIAVRCLTTVTVKETEYGQEYTGNLEVLNGIPYRILISWE